MSFTVSLAIKIILLVSIWTVANSFPNSRNTLYKIPVNPTLPALKILPPPGPNIFSNILSTNQKLPVINTNKLDQHYLNDKSSAGAYYHNQFLVNTDPSLNGKPSHDNNFADEVPTHLIPSIEDPWNNNVPSLPTETDNLSLADWHNYNLRNPNGPGTYAFGYDIEDPSSGNVQFRNEEKHSNGSVIGSYGYLEPDGNVRITHYIADNLGYRATTENAKYKPLKTPFVELPSKIPHHLTGVLPNQNIQNQRQRPTENVKKFNFFYIPH